MNAPNTHSMLDSHLSAQLALLSELVAQIVILNKTLEKIYRYGLHIDNAHE